MVGDGLLLLGGEASGLTAENQGSVSVHEVLGGVRVVGIVGKADVLDLTGSTTA